MTRRLLGWARDEPQGAANRYRTERAPIRQRRRRNEIRYSAASGSAVPGRRGCKPRRPAAAVQESFGWPAATSRCQPSALVNLHRVRSSSRTRLTDEYVAGVNQPILTSFCRRLRCSRGLWPWLQIGFDCRSTVVRPRDEYTTTYVTTVGLPVVGCCTAVWINK